jgi:hypothetical protein
LLSCRYTFLIRLRAAILPGRKTPPFAVSVKNGTGTSFVNCAGLPPEKPILVGEGCWPCSGLLEPDFLLLAYQGWQRSQAIKGQENRTRLAEFSNRLAEA